MDTNTRPYCDQHMEIRDFMIKSEERIKSAEADIDTIKEDIHTMKTHLQEADRDRDKMPIKIISWVVGLIAITNTVLVSVVIHFLK